MKAIALFLNPVPRPIEIPTSLFKNLFTAQKHIVILSSPSANKMDVLLNAINKGLQIEVSKIFPFNQTVEAYQYTERGGVTGKVAIELN